MNAHELLAQIDENSKVQWTSHKTLRHKPLTQMTTAELSDYAYAQVSDFPVPLCQSEKQALLNAMAGAVSWARESDMTSEELSEKHHSSRINRERREAIEEELSRPHLQHIDVEI